MKPSLLFPYAMILVIVVAALSTEWLPALGTLALSATLSTIGLALFLWDGRYVVR